LKWSTGFEKNSTLGALANWKKADGEFVLAAHGDPNQIFDTSSGELTIYTQPDAVAWEISRHPNFASSRAVRLLACNVAKGGANSMAQAIADSLKKPVIATEGFVFFNPSRIYAGNATFVGGRYEFNGTYQNWKTFYPRSGN
jgi:hypothetical protein